MTCDDSISLKEYVDKLFAIHAEVHKLEDVALMKAENTMQVRLESMNEFRAQLNKQQSTFVTYKDIEPLIRFHDKFVGIILAVTFLNAIITALIMMLLRK